VFASRTFAHQQARSLDILSLNDNELEGDLPALRELLYLRRGLAQTLLRMVLDAGRTLGCTQAWVLTDRDNIPAMRLYESVGGDPGTREHVMFEFQLR